MKPIQLKWQAFGPYLQESQIVFSDLEESLFLISGATGGGKTTILDAMCFALYCKSTGGRRDFKSMRCVSAEDETPTIVEFDFQVGKERYCFRRELYRSLKRGTEDYITRDKHECFIWQEEKWKLLASGAETAVRKKAEEILHLTCEQFSQVIVLPQGDFLRFLRASSKEKGEMLETLFSVHKWKVLAEKAAASTRKLSESMKELSSFRKSLLEKENLASEEELKLAEKQANDTKMQLENQKKILAEQLEKSASSLALAENWVRADKIRKEAAHKQQESNQQAQQAEELRQKAEIQKTESEVLRKKATQVAQEKTLLEEKYTTVQSLMTTQKKAAALLQEAEKTRKFIQEEQTIHEQLKEKMIIGKKYVAEAEESAQKWPILLEQITELEKKSEQLQKWKELQKQKEDFLQKIKLAEKQAEEKHVLLQTVSESLAQKEAVLQNNKAAELAGELVQGEPCPVCGSLHHPNLALHEEEPDLLNTIAILRGQKSKAERESIQNQKDCEYLKNQGKLIQEQYELQKAELGVDSSLDSQELSVQIEALQKERLAHKKVADSLPKAKNRLVEYQTKEEEIKEQLQEQQAQMQSMQWQAEALLKTLPTDFKGEEQMQQLIEAIRLKEKEYQDVSAQSEKIRQFYDSAVQKEKETAALLRSAQEIYQKAEQDFFVHQQKWTESAPPDYIQLKQQTEAYRAESLQISEQLGNATARLESMISIRKTIQSWSEQLMKMEARYVESAKISQSLSGNNPYKMPILQYVLRIMLDEILVYANRFFATLSRGRYRLCRKEEPSGGNAISGLDLEVLDGQSMQKRSIETLSGGEQFLASLSLAFGLSDVVQRNSGAVRMDALFIDEGFGSLDQETLDVAMKAIAVLRESGRMIGIISHVSELKQRVSSQIVVQSSAGGFARASIKK
ncbi:AAA family ATPase [Scatolibacter rhodanostii]|uniref:AAA family ATPase n=1 Tax=Scatolibacter rhodanostii TaxID=2014781 RepID=UPI000C07EDC5|nr:SMC family ATPase [Scatolibacter rhodanostii]